MPYLTLQGPLHLVRHFLEACPVASHIAWPMEDVIVPQPPSARPGSGSSSIVQALTVELQLEDSDFDNSLKARTLQTTPPLGPRHA